MAEVQVSVATDMRMFKPALVTMMSAIESTKRPVAVHFLGHGITETAMRTLERAVACWPGTQLQFYDMAGEITDTEGWKARKWNGRHSEMVLADVHVPRLGPGRILYLDSDTLVCADIGPLFDLDLQGCHVAAVRDYEFLVNYIESMPEEWTDTIWDKSAAMYPYPTEDFLNAGVMLFDNDSIASEPGLADAIADPEELLDDTHRFAHMLKGAIFYLDPSWNVICGSHNLYELAHRSMLPDGDNYIHTPPKIMHHLGDDKPWQNFDLDRLRSGFRGRAGTALPFPRHGLPWQADRGAVPQSPQPPLPCRVHHRRQDLPGGLGQVHGHARRLSAPGGFAPCAPMRPAGRSGPRTPPRLDRRRGSVYGAPAPTGGTFDANRAGDRREFREADPGGADVASGARVPGRPRPPDRAQPPLFPPSNSSGESRRSIPASRSSTTRSPTTCFPPGSPAPRPCPMSPRPACAGS